MKHYDHYGRGFYEPIDLFNMLYENPDLDLSKVLVSNTDEYNRAVRYLYADFPELKQIDFLDQPIEIFDQKQQCVWHMPESYKKLDIAQWVLQQCKTQDELQRVGQELLLFQERNLFDLLRYLKYLVDTMRQHKIVWGVGRGSSTASYVLYIIGVHKINSIYYDLDIKEFLKGDNNGTSLI